MESNRVETQAKLIKALIKTQKEIETVTKDRSNPIAKSTYATLDAILDEVLPKLNKNGIFLTQRPLSKIEENGRTYLGVETTLYHEDGGWLTYEPFFMEIEENARMNMAQSAGSIITYAKRYAVSAILGISTDEDKDGVQPESFTQEPQKELTTEEAFDYKIGFGKHKGKTVGTVAKEDKSYMRWLLDNAKDERMKDAIRKVGKKMKEEEESGYDNQVPDGFDEEIDRYMN